jgi:hypothetical protein
MDNLPNDNLLSDVDVVAGGVKNVLASIRNKAKARKAQKISDAGGYLSLTPFQKSLIDIPDYILNQTAGSGATNEDIKNLPADTSEQLKQFLPYIIGAIVIGILLYVILKK